MVCSVCVSVAASFGCQVVENSPLNGLFDHLPSEREGALTLFYKLQIHI